MPGRDGGELGLSIHAFGKESVESKVVPGDVGEVGDGELAADEVLLLGEDDLENTEDTLDLLGVALDAVRDLLGGKDLEVSGLSKVGLLREKDQRPRLMAELKLHNVRPDQRPGRTRTG